MVRKKMQMWLRICSLRGCKGNFAQEMKITCGEINPFFQWDILSSTFPRSKLRNTQYKKIRHFI